MQQKAKDLIQKNRLSPARIFLEGLNLKYRLSLYPSNGGIDIAEKLPDGSFAQEYAHIDQDGRIEYKEGFQIPPEDRIWLTPPQSMMVVEEL